MNYKFAKNFFVFYENLQFPSSRALLEGKFEIIWKNQKTTFLLKKNFFSSIKYSRGIRRSPGDTIKVFHPPMGGEMMKTLTLINLGSKSRFYYISQNGPIFGSQTHEDLSTVIFQLFSTILDQKTASMKNLYTILTVFPLHILLKRWEVVLTPPTL